MALVEREGTPVLDDEGRAVALAYQIAPEDVGHEVAVAWPRRRRCPVCGGRLLGPGGVCEWADG